MEMKTDSAARPASSRVVAAPFAVDEKDDALWRWLGPEDEARARMILAELVERTISTLPARFDEERLARYVTLLGLDAFMPQIHAHAYACPEALVRDIARGVGNNPVLLALLGDRPNGERAPGPPWSDEGLIDALHYANLLHALVHAMMMERPGRSDCLMRRVQRTVHEQRARVPWKRYANAFERLKVRTVDIPFNGWTAEKAGERDVTASGHRIADVTLTGNIMEAMYQDWSLGNAANAEAGFELLADGVGLPPFESAIGNAPCYEWRLDGSPMGISIFRPPLARSWCDLYQSWNLAFCSNYRNSLQFFAKLLTPAVGLAYADDPGPYMYRRVSALFVHAHFEIFSRVERGQRTPLMDQRAPALTARWGEINRSAGQAYRLALRDASSPKARAARARRRLWKRLVWGGVRAAGRVGRGIAALGSRR